MSRKRLRPESDRITVKIDETAWQILRQIRLCLYKKEKTAARARDITHSKAIIALAQNANKDFQKQTGIEKLIQQGLKATKAYEKQRKEDSKQRNK